MHKARRTLLLVGLASLLLGLLPLLGGAEACNSGPSFYVPPPRDEALAQIRSLVKKHDFADAILLTKMVTKSHAVWLTGGTPAEVKKQVKKTLRLARAQHAIPVFAVYNLPYRDCAQYSAGGAVNTAAYEAWIDGVAAGIGAGKAKVVLEPDGLGLIPYYKQFQGLPSEAANYEWCQPQVDGAPAPEADPAHRFEQLNYAVDQLEALPSVDVYLDATHSNWLGSGDAAHRLVQGGVLKAEGFFLNVSNYQATDHLIKYGTWIAKCIWFATDPGSWGNGHFDWCGSQYYPATVTDFSTWTLTDQWYTNNVESQTWVPYPGDAGLKHFVIDTGRNGQGPWSGNLDWCNAPGRGNGIAPTTDTGNDLIDAYLWVKVPGESDGSCDARWVNGGDPEWGGLQDPAAGAWFPEQALQLAQLANPPLKW